MSASSRIHEGMTFVVITTFVTEFSSKILYASVDLLPTNEEDSSL